MRREISYFIIALAFIGIIFSCEKDVDLVSTVSVEQSVKEDTFTVQGRNLIRDIVFYQKSMTTDNYQLTVDPSVKREYIMFNKNLVAYVTFNRGLLDKSTIGGILHGHYKMRIVFKDSSDFKLVVWTKDSTNSFKITPYGKDYLKSNHSAKYVKWVHNSTNGRVINEYLERDAPRMLWDIYYNNTLVATEERYTRDRLSNIFIVQKDY